MAIVEIPWTAQPPDEVRGGAVTVGNFDGVHRGHRELVAAAWRWADRLGGPAVALTFDPPPVNLLAPHLAKPPLSTVADRAELLHAAGADHVVVLHTDPGLLSLSPEAFFEDVLVRQLRVRAMAEGYNFHFGRNRAGDTALLRTLCAASEIAFVEVPPVVVDGEPVSSSRVRAAITAGDVQRASELLGRPYRLTGTVVAGAKRGRTIGFPTANLDGVATLVPAIGVYAVRVILGGKLHDGAANLGPNPTFGEDATKIEVHVLDFDGDVYGRMLAVDFIARLRETRPFAGVAELVVQLERDVAAARAALAAAR